MLVSRRLSRVVLGNSCFKVRTFPAHCPLSHTRTMKRKAESTNDATKKKRRQAEVPDYCDVDPVKDEDGGIIWPAPQEAIEKARGFLREW